MARSTSRLLLLMILCMIAVPTFLLVNHSDASFVPSFLSSDGEPPDLSYGIIMDAGSTGTRLFLYCWESKSDQELINIRPTLDEANNPVVKKSMPGLSSFGEKPEEATAYIKPLLDYAVQYVPVDKRPYTPIFILATAGMRLIPEEQQKAIMNNLHTNLPTVTNMQVMKEHIKIIDGKWEGIYSWIAVNYILGKFNTTTVASNQTTELHDTTTTQAPITQRKPTVGIIDMGGASVQIAYELAPNETFRSDSVTNVNLGCRDDDPKFKYKLFVTTFLGFGVNEGLRKYEQYLSDRVIAENSSYARDECMPVNLQKVINRDDGTMFVKKGVGDWDACVDRLSTLLTTKTESSSMCLPQCFFGSVPAPLVQLSAMEMYGFSEYWFSVDHVLALGGLYNHTLMSEKSKNFCSQRWSNIQAAARRKLYPKADDSRLKTQCFKSAWITAVLHAGFSVNKNQNKFQSAYTIAGQEIQWALGAMIYHMRYFPLRDSQHNLIVNKHPSSSITTSFSVTTALIIVTVILALAYFCVFVRQRHRGMRRNPSMWTYMMVNGDEFMTMKTFRSASYA